MGKTKTKKGRGHRTHGRGRKKGRGKGLRGGKGNAGLHKHKYATTVILEKQGVLVFGRHGFKRPKGTLLADIAINVGDLSQLFPGQTTLDLGQHGYTKLLGAGEAPGKVTVTVEAASEGAIEKIQAAGGTVTTTREKPQPKAAAPPGKPGQAGKPAAKSGPKPNA